MEPSFSPVMHTHLVALLAQSDYVERYVALCERYPMRKDFDGPRLDLKRILDIFRENGVTCRLEKRFKVFIFDGEEVNGWRWDGSLVIKRHDALNPMREGHSLTERASVGSNLIGLADEVLRLKGTHKEEMRRFSRPDFDGRMEQMVPDLVGLFRSMKATVRQYWPGTDRAR